MCGIEVAPGECDWIVGAGAGRDWQAEPGAGGQECGDKSRYGCGGDDEQQYRYDCEFRSDGSRIGYFHPLSVPSEFQNRDDYCFCDTDFPVFIVLFFLSRGHQYQYVDADRYCVGGGDAAG